MSVKEGFCIRSRNWQQFSRRYLNAYRLAWLNCQHLLTPGGRKFSNYERFTLALMGETIENFKKKEMEIA